jgi:hypothetical protein
MRRFLIPLVYAALIAVMWLAGTHAHAGQNCWGIQSADERAFCRALQSGQKSQCSAIMGYDLRATCFVRLGSPKAVCATVKPGWPRVQCQDASAPR